MPDRPWRLGPAGCRRRYHSPTPNAASVPLPSATSPGMTQGLAGWAAGVVAGGAGTCGWVTGGIVSVSSAGAGVVVVGAARTTSVAPPKAPPPQRPEMVWVPAALERGILVVVVKVPSGLTAAYTAGTSAKSWVWTNALESRVTPFAQAEPAASGPTDPDRVTVSPAATELGLTWMAAGGVVGAARTPTVPPPRGDPPQRR